MPEREPGIGPEVEREPYRPRRVCVVGNTGCGKSTFAARLARLIDAVHIELDALHWEPGWTEATPEAFRGRVERATRAERWVADGNYPKARPLLWPLADTLVWLDPPLHVTMRRLLARSFRRVRRREALWSGNRETLRQSFFSRDSVILWSLRMHGRRRREYARLFADPGATHLRLVRLATPAACEAYLASVREAAHPDWPVIAKIG